VAAAIQGPSGVVAVDDRVATSGTLELTVAPNPVQGKSRVEFAMPVAGDVTLTVFDLRGAYIATLADGIAPAGRHSTVWEGAVDEGGSAPAGVYFVRLVWRGDGRTETAFRRVVLTR
jgi:flagellar hook assembly protein FlgD